jgi:hypothetical protein
METVEVLLEDLAITKLNWKKEINGYAVDINDSIDPAVLPRLYDRTKIPLKILRDNIYELNECFTKDGFFFEPSLDHANIDVFGDLQVINLDIKE